MIGDPFQDAVLITLMLVTLGGVVAIGVVAGRRHGWVTAVAGAMTWYVGVGSAGFGVAHLVGVLYTATQRGYYSYDFRFASLLLVGLLLVIGGAMCVTALSELRQGRQPDWGRATEGSLLLLVVAIPLLPVQPAFAAPMVIGGVANLIAVLAAPRLFARSKAR